MPEKKQIIGNIITGVVVGILLMFATGFAKNTERNRNAASKDDVKKVKIEMVEYTNTAKCEAIKYTDDKMSAQEKTFKATLNGIDGKIDLMIKMIEQQHSDK